MPQAAMTHEVLHAKVSDKTCGNTVEIYTLSRLEERRDHLLELVCSMDLDKADHLMKGHEEKFLELLRAKPCTEECLVRFTDEVSCMIDEALLVKNL